MQEKAFSPETAEEVIDLLDIVPARTEQEEQGEDIVELTAEHAEERGSADADDVAADIEGDVLELTDVVESAPLELPGSEEKTASESTCEDASGPAEEPAPASECVSESAAEAAPVPVPVPTAGPAVEPAAVSYVDEDSFLKITSELEAKLSALEEARTAEAQAFERRFAALEQALAEKSAEVLALRQKLEACEKDAAQPEGEGLEERLVSLLEVRFSEFALSQAAEVQALEERAAAAEEKLEAAEKRLGEAETGLAALAEALEAERQKKEEQISHIFSEDSARLALEEMVSPMLEGRLSAVSEAEAEKRRAEEEAHRAFVDAVDELNLHVGELEKRVAEWEVRCEQESALAAARVIREEIAAMRAGAARMAR